ncbi:hypothetical protein P5W99_03700 [Paraburkholderia sp. A3BS-1L]|uniref:hypothetical protein n=1 Tax=unclassified Paraburkholderia TaxID=2615204 RepID=UPI003B7D368D
MHEAQTSSAAPGQDPPTSTVEPDRALQLAVLRIAMREQGFGERSITTVLRRAERLLDALHAQGVTIARPRVFDPEAPSLRNRNTCAEPQQRETREVDCARPDSLRPVP